MRLGEKSASKVEELRGKAKHRMGKATGHDRMRAEGRAEQARGSLRQAAEKVKDAFRR